MNRAAVLAALASAALFGVSTPAAKALLGVVHPVILAGLFYCGAGIGIALLRALAALGLNAPAARQQPLARQDYGWLAGAIPLCGIARPVLAMLRAARTARGRARRLRLLRREPRAVRGRAASPRYSAHRRIFLDCPLHRRGDRGDRAPATADGAARRRRNADGLRRLAAPHRAARARACPSPHAA